jgi:hypothetical protein
MHTRPHKIIDTGETKTIREIVCKGCKIYEKFRICVFIPTVYKHTCPCSKCLVKMVCITDKACNRMVAYRNVINIYKEATKKENKTMSFREELTTLINEHSLEGGSNTPDFLLADYLKDTLNTFDKLMTRRDLCQGKSERKLVETYVENLKKVSIIGG